MDILDLLQRDIDEINTFGFYAITTAHETLSEAKREIERLRAENQ